MHRVIQPDPRIKLLTAAVFAACVAVSPARPEPIAFFTLMLTVGHIVLRIPVRTTAARMTPLFGLAMAAIVGVVFGAPVGVTAYLTLRLILISVAAIILTASTPPTELLAAMRWFRAPWTIITILMLTSRYLNVMEDETRRSSRAWRSRLVGGSIYRHAVSLGMVAVTLARRAVERSDRIALAMVARGFEGRLPVPPLPRLRMGDVVACALFITALVGAALWR